ncbi:MAG: ABC transporter ATP-binding protein [Crocinitomicaceae bacterium]|jgi:ATP-binding cassette, subfamily B, multidrug efflux pump|nr:ABC transporter ATP-binding protein [Crocinitomicaceae bacterium]MBT6513634.1 ABC transporter ATP-binding protein [Crocinitomicaceae bacterium]
MKSLAYLNKYIWKYRGRILLGFLFILASNIIQAIMPSKVQEAIDQFTFFIAQYPNVDSKEIFYADNILPFTLNIILIYMALALLRAVFVFMMRQTIIILSRLIEFDLKNEIYDHYQRLHLGFYKENNTGDLMNRISEDVTKARMYLGPAIMYSINLICLFTVTLVFMLDKSVELTLWTLIPLPIMSILIYFVSHTMNKRSERVQNQQSKLTTFVQEMFSGIRIVKAYNRQEEAYKSFQNESTEYKKRSLKLVLINAFFMPIILLLIGLSTIITIYVGGIKTIDGDISYGDIVQFVIYVNLLTWPFASIGWVTSIIQRAAASQERINEFLKEQPQIESGPIQATNLKGRLEFRNVTFSYPNDNKEVLNDISFVIEPGKTLAIIGRTGSGKSTVSDLAARMYDPLKGTILLDGIPLDNYELSSLRSNIGYVPQEVFLFSDTIANNISFGIENGAEMDRIEKAAVNAHIHHNIIDFKDGYSSVMGERGLTLSGGQKQRISIARALIREPKLMLLDDCLSAVDTETEAAILSNLKEIMSNNTTIISSHRISSIQHADEIIVLDQGKIIERGTHQALLNKKGDYFSLYKKQLTDN